MDRYDRIKSIKYKYTREVLMQKDGTFLISIKEFNGCLTIECEDLVEGFKELDRVFDEWVDAAKECGYKIPVPAPMFKE